MNGRFDGLNVRCLRSAPVFEHLSSSSGTACGEYGNFSLTKEVGHWDEALRLSSRASLPDHSLFPTLNTV